MRKWLRLSQTFVARNLNKKSKSVISSMESDPDKRIEVNDLVSLCELFHCSPNDILGFDINNDLHPDITVNARAHSENDLTAHEVMELNELYKIVSDKRSSFGPYKEFNTRSQSPQLILEELLGHFGVNSAPIDIFNIASELGIYVRFSALTNLSGALVHSKETNLFGVLLNSDQPENRIRFSLAHEISHRVLSHYKNESYSYSLLGKSKKPIEREADDFASELLIPYKILKSTIKSLAIQEFAPLEVFTLSQYFFVSYQAMLLKLFKKQFITRTHYLESKSVKVGELKARVESNQNEVNTVAFEPSILDEIIEKDRILSVQEKFTPATIRLLQERACEYYHNVTINSIRETEVKTIYEEVVLWLLNRGKAEKQEISNPAEYLTDKGFIVIDKRDKGGCLWVIDHKDLSPFMSVLKREGYDFNFLEKGGKASKNEPAWYL